MAPNVTRLQQPLSDSFIQTPVWIAHQKAPGPIGDIQMAILASMAAIIAGAALMWGVTREAITVDVQIAGSALLIAGVFALLLSLFFFSCVAPYGGRPSGGRHV